MNKKFIRPVENLQEKTAAMRAGGKSSWEFAGGFGKNMCSQA